MKTPQQIKNEVEKEKKITLIQFLKKNATVTKYAFGNWTNKEYWKGYKRGWIECMNNLLLEARGLKLK